MLPHPFDIAPISRQIWDQKYRLKAPDGTPLDSDIDATWWRVARAVAAHEKGGKRKQAEWAGRFHEMLSDFTFLPAGRIIAGAGTGRRVTLFNCFVMGRIEDDLGSIFENVREAALTMQQGGGIGHDFSTLRPQGAPVRSTGSDASGPVSFMDVWDAMCRTIMSSGARRGAMMGTMRCDHPDIERFIDVKASDERLRNFNLSVLVTDAFIEAVRKDAPWELVFGGRVWRTLPARALWDRMMRATYDYAEPGAIFIDRINARNNLAYCEEIHATNPCVTADTWVQTSEGPRQVNELVGRQVLVRVDGLDHPTSREGFFPTGHKPVVRLKTLEGYSLRLTADHRLRCVVRRSRWHVECEWRAASELRQGDLVILNDHANADSWTGEGTSEEGYLLGLLVGDGTLKADKAILSVWWPAAAANGESPGPDQGVRSVMDAASMAAATLPHRSDFTGWVRVRGRNEFRLALGAVRQLAIKLGMTPSDKALTPAVERTSSDFYRGFLRGFFDADGSVQGTQTKGVSVRLAQSDLQRLHVVQRMLLRLGIASSVYRNRRIPRSKVLPDGRGGHDQYPTAAQHELVISGQSLVRYQSQVGFADANKSDRLHRALANYKRALNRERFTAKVESVTLDSEETVFDVQVPGINAFDANGFHAHNCGEQPLPPHGACLLGSINLARLVERPFAADSRIDIARLEALTRLAVRFLDNCIDVSSYPLPAQKQEARNKRRVGLGVTGLADALILVGQHYGSAEASRSAETWMAAIERAAYLASADLAAEKGAFPLYDRDKILARPNLLALPQNVRAQIEKKGLRNGCLTSIAPTGTISLLAGNVSSGVEPIFDFEYTRRVRQPDGGFREEQVADFAYALHRATAGTGVAADAALPPAFVTADELTPRAHLQMQAALQRHVDSSISKTINCPADLAFEDFKTVYLEAYDLGLKGCTTFRPNAVTGSILAHAPAQPSAAASIADAAPRHASPVQPQVPAPTMFAGASPSVVYMSKPLERDPALAGYTYKLKWPGSDHAIYVTINDIERDGRRRPFEIFINTKNLEHYAWTVALTRMISAVFRRGGEVSFVVEELKAVFDPQGGHWIEGRYVPSLLAAIGEVIERHMRRTGFLQHEVGAAASDPALDVPLGDEDAAVAMPDALGAKSAANSRRQPACPRCARPEMVREAGCCTCRSCGYSRCG